MQKAFTLIELLVVVLIIGILSAIALPQYTKAVKKAKMAQLDVSYNATKKAVDMYLLENGFPTGGGSGPLRLTGNSGLSDITIPGNCNDEKHCYTNAGRVLAMCQPSQCTISISSFYDVNGNSGNTWLSNNEVIMSFRKTTSKDWYVHAIAEGGTPNNLSTEVKSLLCPWVKKYYPNDSKVITICG